MTGSNSILPFASGSNANVVTDQQWQSLVNGGSLNTGFLQGLAQSAQVNKALRQTSAMSSGFAQFLANHGNNVSDSLSPEEIASMLKLGMQDVIKESNLTPYIQAWQSSVAYNGTGYPKYAVVADPNYMGVLYMSLVDNNSAEPNFIYPVSQWLTLPPNRILSVETFGVVNDPNQQRVNENSEAFLQAVNLFNDTNGLIGLYVPGGFTFSVNQMYWFNYNLRLILDGIINFTGAGDFLTINGVARNVITGCGQIKGNNQGTVIKCNSSVIIDGIQVQGGAPYGIWVTGGYSFINNVNCSFNENDIYINVANVWVNGAYIASGIQLGTCAQVKIANVNFFYCTNTAISVDPNFTGIQDLMISGCYFNLCERGAISIVGKNNAIIYNLTIEDCHFFSTGTKGASSDIYIDYSQQVQVLKNSSNGNSNSATNISGSNSISAFVFGSNINNLVVKDNLILNPGPLNGRYSYGMWFESSTNTIVKENIIQNSNNTLLAPMGGNIGNSFIVEGNTYNNQEFTIETPNTNGVLGIGLNFPNIGVGLLKSGTDIVQRSGVFTCNYNGNYHKERYSAIFLKTPSGWLTMQSLWFPCNDVTCNNPFSYWPWGNFSVQWSRLWRFPFNAIMLDLTTITPCFETGLLGTDFCIINNNMPNLEYGNIGTQYTETGGGTPTAGFWSCFLRCIGVTNGPDYDYANNKGWQNFNDMVDNTVTVSPPFNTGWSWFSEPY